MEEEARGNQRCPWTRSEEKVFEAAIVNVPEGTRGRWLRISEVLPGRSPEELEQHYNDLVFDVWDIDMGLVPLPDYPDELPKDDVAKVPARAKVEVVRKKGRPWTQDEHRLFLLGLQMYKKGDWRSISRDVVVTRTPTQVASHAQKYFIRQNAPNKSRRSSIHDTTLSPMQESNEGGLLGYDNQEGSPGRGKSVANTNNGQISPPSQITNHIGCSSWSHVTAHDNSPMMLPHYNSPEDGDLSSIGYVHDIHINAGSSLARSPNPRGSMGNCNFTNIYHQECPIGYNNDTPPRNNRMISLQNQFSMGSTSSSVNMNGHIVSPQPQIPQQIGPSGYYSSNMISHSVPPPAHLHSMNGHPGSVRHVNTSDGPNSQRDQPPN